MPESLIYGWKRDTPDERDTYLVMPQSAKPLPSVVDLRPGFQSIYSQGRIGSCSAQATGAIYQYSLRKHSQKEFLPSRLFIYYNARSYINTVGYDSGSTLRDCLKSIASLGVCTETEWSYNDTPANPVTGLWPQKAKPAMKPLPICYNSAKKRKALSYSRVTPSLDQLQTILAEGYPISFGFLVHSSFESAAVARSGVLNMPTSSEKAKGGHAVVLVGYDNGTSRFIVRNSWGEKWGQGGYFTMPYQYVTTSNLADDFWVLRTVTG